MAVLAEELHAVDVNVSLALFGTMLDLFPVLLGGTPQQAERIFAPFTSGQGTPLAAFAFSEPGGSANFAAPAPGEGVRTQARLENDHWVISGAKKWVSSGTCWEGKGADLLTVVCRTDLHATPESGISVIAVQGPAEGIDALEGTRSVTSALASLTKGYEVSAEGHCRREPANRRSRSDQNRFSALHHRGRAPKGFLPVRPDAYACWHAASSLVQGGAGNSKAPSSGCR